MVKLKIGKFRLGVTKKHIDFYFGNRVYRHSFNRPIQPDTPLQIIVKHYRDYESDLFGSRDNLNFSGAKDVFTIGCKKTTDNKTFGNYVVIPSDRVQELINKLIELK